VFYLIFLMFRAFWVLVLCCLLLVISVPVMLGGAVVFLGHYLVTYLRVCGRSMGVAAQPALAAIPLPPVTTTNGIEPAYRHYLFGPAGADLRHTARLTRPALLDRQRYLSFWIKDRFFGSGMHWSRGAIGLLLWCGLAVGACLGAVVVGTVVLFQLAFWGVFLLLGLVLLYALRGLDTGLLLVRGIHLSCPSCHHRVVYPAYACPNQNCSVRHRDVRPGRYGLTRRRCRCGMPLPTLLLLGSHRMAAYCPYCEAPMADRAGTAAEVVLPLVGASSAGKTRLAIAMAMEMREMDQRHGLTAEPADEYTRREYDHLVTALRNAETTRPTVLTAVRAYSFQVASSRRRRRLLHVYDASGERMNNSERLRELRYLRLAEAFILVIDPLGLDGVWLSLPPAARTTLGTLRSPGRPDFVFSQVLDNLHAMGVATRHKSLAVAVTKHDLVGESGLLTGVGETSDDIERFLRDQVALDNMVRSMRMAFSAVRFFWTSATLDEDGRVDPSIGQLTTWAMRRSGLRVR
jgi:hypothetical protein